MERLKELRTQHGYSQQELGDRAGVAQHTISEIELGRRDPRGRTLRKLAEALGVDVADFYAEPELPKAPSRPSPAPPVSGDEGRRALYLNAVLEEARSMARSALWMRDVGDYGETPGELSQWNWKITGHLQRIWVMQQRWGTLVFGPVVEQELPPWERNLLDQIREELEKAEDAATKAREVFTYYVSAHDAEIKEAFEHLTPEQFLRSVRGD